MLDRPSMFAPTAATVRCSSSSISATAASTSGSPSSTQLARSAGATVVGSGHRAPAPARSRALRRHGQGRGDRAALRARDRRRRWSIFNQPLSAAQERNLESALRVPRHRPHQPDPRHLRAARAQPRRQAAGRARAARAPVDAPGARLDPPRAPEGRHRPARPRRDAARDRPPPDRRAREDAEGAARAAWQRSARRSAARGERADVRTVSLVGYTNAGKSTLFNRLTGAQAYAADQLFATLDTTLRRVARRRRGSRSCSPTRSASSATCRTTWSPPSARRSRRPSRPTCCCTWSTRPRPIATSRSRRSNAVLAEIGAGRRAADPRVQQDRPRPGSRPGVERDAYGKITAVRVSALTGAGCDDSRMALAERFAPRAPDLADRRRGVDKASHRS